MRAAPLRSRWERHLDGWQAGAIVLLLAGGVFALAIPRPVAPELPPPPAVDWRALSAASEADEARARAAETAELPFDVRAMGSALRDYNQAAARAEEGPFVEARMRVVEAARAAYVSSGVEPLLALRAWQTRRFLEELGAWERDGVVSGELEALGGDFLRSARRWRWCVAGERRLLAADDTLRVLYKKRWNEVTGLRDGPFALELEEERARFAFLMRHPPRQGESDEQARREAYRMRLELAGRIEELDEAYPADFARGVSLFGLGHFVQAADAFRRHLERFPDGPYSLRAQNHLRAALELAQSSIL